MRTLDEVRKYEFYEKSVQNPEVEVEFINHWYKKIHGREPTVLREDFCGTAAISRAWVAYRRSAEAIGVDFDPEPLKKAREEYKKGKETKRLTLIQGDVLQTQISKVDVICAFNFSYFIFKQRSVLLQYFKQARQGLKKQGMFFLDIFGGPESQNLVTDVKKLKNLTYYWECQQFNPINQECTFAIHFKDHKGIKYKNVFTYDWRLWSIVEIRELLIEAGFSRTMVFWEGDGPDGTGDGIFSHQEVAENSLSWVAYIAGLI
jgi:hypothetical protein